MKQNIGWRYFRVEDWPYVLALHIEQELKLGREMDLPNLMEEPVITALVKLVDGKITNVVFSEAEIEVCGLGNKPISKSDVEIVSKLMIRDAQRYDIRIARAFVPKQALKERRKPWARKAKKPPIKRILDAAQMNEVGEEMVEFYRWIPKQGG